MVYTPITQPIKKAALFCLLFLIITVFWANQSFSADPNRLGEKTEKNRLTCQEVYHAVDSEKVETTDMVLDKVLKIYFQNTEGLTEADGKVYPGLSIEVLSPQNKQVLYSENALAEFSENGLPKAFSKNISATIGVASPMRVGEAYAVNLRLWDTKGDGEITYKTKIAITGKSTKEKIPTGEIISSGLTAKGVLLLKDEKAVKFDLLTIGDIAKLALIDVGRFEKAEDGLYSIDMDISIANSTGKTVKQVQGILKESGHTGLKSDTTNLSAIIDTKGYQPGKYTATITAYDKTNKNRVTAKKSFGLINLKG